MRQLRSAATKEVVLVVVAIILIAIAGAYTVTRGTGEEPAPDDQFVSFKCRACGESFQLSYAEFEKVWDEGRFKRQDDGRTLLYQCPKCGQIQAERAMDAPTSGP